MATKFEIEDESDGDYPNALGLVGAAATYTPAEGDATRVTIRGTDHDRATDTWTVWIEIDGDVIETTGAHVTEVGQP